MYDFSKFCNVANALSQCDEEEYCRSAMNRYYYSLFGCTRLYLIFIMREFEFGRGRDVHKRICNRLINSNDKTEKSLGEILDKLRNFRNIADYDWGNDYGKFFQDNLFYVQNESQKGLEQLEALKRSPPYNL